MPTDDVVNRLICALVDVDDEGYVRVLSSDLLHILTFIDQDEPKNVLSKDDDRE